MFQFHHSFSLALVLFFPQLFICRILHCLNSTTLQKVKALMDRLPENWRAKVTLCLASFLLLVPKYIWPSL